jgi:aerobic carbon-monoxide dehydrogenase small subunit
VLNTQQINLELIVNGDPVSERVAPDTSLIELLRLTLGLTGTNQGCDTAQCGACTVLVDGQAIKSCNVLALQMQGRAITTIEAPTLHIMQQVFIDHGALQCGYCTSGMIMRAVAMVHERVAIDEHAVALALGGNLCRCTGYHNIVQAVMQGLTILRASQHLRGIIDTDRLDHTNGLEGELDVSGIHSTYGEHNEKHKTIKTNQGSL